tara:strand:+ start:146 stop:799 length:654 start_codon:yes stop_codon:yes gene_type:complete
MNHASKRIFTSIILIIVVYFALINSVILFSILLIVAYHSINEFNNLFKKIFTKKKFFYFLSLISTIIYIAFFSLIIWSFLYPLNKENITIIIFLFFVCSGTDIGGYVFGKIIGGKKLTKISPNKTISGLIGSFVLSFTIGLTFYKLFSNNLIFDINILVFIFLISLISQSGDLIISIFKRKAKVKDTGSFLPGHGGILDRIDGMLFALPVGIILVVI